MTEQEMITSKLERALQEARQLTDSIEELMSLHTEDAGLVSPQTAEIVLRTTKEATFYAENY